MSIPAAEKNLRPGSVGNRGKNWSDEECGLLAKRWIAVTEDPEKGKDQTRDAFWDKVSEQIKERNGLSCMKTFQKDGSGCPEVFLDHVSVI